MDSLDQQVLDATLRWQAQGHRFALATVARTWGSAPRQPGAWLALCDDGRVQGSVSGGCIEDDPIERMRAGTLAHPQGMPTDRARPTLVTYGGHREAAHRHGLPCGGTLALVVEPEPDLASLQQLQQGIQAGRLMRRRVDLRDGSVTVMEADRGPEVQWDGEVLTTTHGPRWRLLVIGAGQVTRFLVPIAQSLGFAVSVCDPRPEHHTEWDVPDAPWVPGMPDDVVLALRPDPRTAVVALTHDPKLDDLALIEALRSPAYYVGALGSVASNTTRRARLCEHFELSAEEVGRLHGPIGLPIGSRTPPEIAVAIAAELVAVRQAAAVGVQPSEAAWPPSRTPACLIG